MTAMSLQALSRYTDREDVQAAVDKALDYLKRNINMGDYGTVESNDQVILTLLMLGIAPRMMTVDLRPGARIFSPRQMSTESKAAVSPIRRAAP